MKTAGPQTYFEEGSCYIWSVRLPLCNDIKFASIQNTYDSLNDYFNTLSCDIASLFNDTET